MMIPAELVFVASCGREIGAGRANSFFVLLTLSLVDPQINAEVTLKEGCLPSAVVAPGRLVECSLTARSDFSDNYFDLRRKS